MTSVAASTHSRQFQTVLTEITGGATPLGDIPGLGFTGGLDTLSEVVYAGDAPYDNPLCLEEGFADTTDFTGQIVVCDRGETGRVEKSQVVAALNAAGYVLTNDEPNAASLNSDAFTVPGVHISYDDGVILKAYLDDVTESVTATITGQQRVVDDAYGDVMASFPSRGENPTTDVVTPNITAPGLNIVAAINTPYDDEGQVTGGPQWGIISGTSMSSPHLAGAAALVRAVHPDWSPDQVRSAMMTTSLTDLVKEDETTPADPFDFGAGRVDLTKAAEAGFLLDETEDGYLAANPAEGGDPRELNVPSFADSQCLSTCSWTRTLTGSAGADTAWTVTDGDEAYADDLGVTVEPANFTLADGETQDITVTVDVAGFPEGEYVFDSIDLTPETGTAVPVAHMPIAVQPTDSIVPDAVDIATRRDATPARRSPRTSRPVRSTRSATRRTGSRSQTRRRSR